MQNLRFAMRDDDESIAQASPRALADLAPTTGKLGVRKTWENLVDVKKNYPIANEEKQKLLESITLQEKAKAFNDIVNFYLHESKFHTKTVQ